ncbi:MAG: hypothetical protein AMS24_04250 [Chlamydiae bacterium SM23_39]|nr:MAG: hypothetical protein AMS24_04250 [Chlamydiae bacterium SM23_39]
MKRDDSEKTIKKSTTSFFCGSLCSRFSGAFRDITLAYFFGSSAFIATFMVAFRFANLFRRFFGESIMQMGFVPYFEEIRKKGDKEGAIFYRDLSFSVLIFLLIIVFFIEAILIFLKKNFLKGYFYDIVDLSSIMLIGIIFISLFSINSSLLQCQKKYFLPSFSPVIFNFTWIASIFLLKNQDGRDIIYKLSFIVVLAFFFQWLFISFPSFKFLSANLKKNEFFKAKIFSYNTKKMVKPFILGAVGIGAVQINTALDFLFAKMIDSSGPAYLWYASRIYQLPLALFAVSIVRAVLPPLSRAYAGGDMDRYRYFINISLRRTVVFMFSFFICLVFFGGSSINLLFGRGGFKEVSVINTMFCLWGYSFGLIFVAFTFILAAAFYARKRFDIPTKAAIFSAVCNILFNILFAFVLKLRTESIAFATSLSSFIHFLYLYFSLKKEMELFDKRIMTTFLKVVFTNIIAISLIFFINIFLDESSIYVFSKKFSFSSDIFVQLRNFFVLSFTYLIFFILTSILIKNRDFLDFIKID